MRKILVPAVVAAVVASASLAFASDFDSGKVTSVDTKAATITLQDGVVYQLPKDYKGPTVKAGQTVLLGWVMKDGKNMVTSVTLE